jgi:hypothetical protein
MTNSYIDNIGVPTTFISIYLNVISIWETQIVNTGFTFFLSILSAIYLITKIKNERKKGKLLDDKLNEKD